MVGKRIIAMVIDGLIFLFPIMILFNLFLPVYFLDLFEIKMSVHEKLIFRENSSIVGFFLYFFVPEVLFSRTFTKWLLNLKVQKFRDTKGNKMLLNLARVTLKFIAIISVVGIPISLIIYVSRGYCWYDKLLGLYMIDTKADGLSDVQKNWREHFNDKH